MTALHHSAAAAACGGRSKSSGKCLIALSTGHRASARPWRTASRRSCVSHRSSSSIEVRVAARSPAMIRSIASTPRVGADPARRALAARLDGAELHREAGHPRHVDGVVEDHDAAVAEHARPPRRTPRSPSARRAWRREVGAERAADLHGPHRAARRRAAAVLLDELAQGDAERQSRRCRPA